MDAGGGQGVLGRLRSAIARALFAERERPGRGWREPSTRPPALLDDSRLADPPRRPRREPDRLDEAAVIAAHRERALRRVAAAAGEACDDWSQGLDVDDAMLRLRAELQSAAEFDA